MISTSISRLESILLTLPLFYAIAISGFKKTSTSIELSLVGHRHPEALSYNEPTFDDQFQDTFTNVTHIGQNYACGMIYSYFLKDRITSWFCHKTI